MLPFRVSSMLAAVAAANAGAAHQQAVGIDAVGRAGHQGNVVLPLYGL